MPTDGEGMEGRDTDGRLVSSSRPSGSIAAARAGRLSVSEEKAKRAERTLKLQELLDTWRTRATNAHTQHTLSGDVCEKVYVQCAKELQEVLDAR